MLEYKSMLIVTVASLLYLGPVNGNSGSTSARSESSTYDMILSMSEGIVKSASPHHKRSLIIEIQKTVR